MRERARPLVVKFGGASLEDLGRVIEDLRAVRARGAPVVVVASARQGVTDALLNGLAHPRAVSLHRRILDELRERHPDLPVAGRRHSTACNVSSPRSKAPGATIRPDPTAS